MSRYKYSQETGEDFKVNTIDHCDAMEDTNEVRQVLDDLGELLHHSKFDDSYPKDETAGGYLGKLNGGLDAEKPASPVVNDMYLATDTVKIYRCFTVGNWTQVYPMVDGVTKTGTFTAGKIVKVNNASGIVEMGSNTDTEVADAVTKKHTQNSDTHLGTVDQDIAMNTHKLTGLSVPSSNGDSIRSTTKITEANLEDGVDKKHSQNTDAHLGTVDQDIPMSTHKFSGLSVPASNGDSIRATTKVTEANLEDAIDKKHTHGNMTELDKVSDGDHDIRTDNPHAVTKTQVSLGNVTDDAQLKRAAGDINSFNAKDSPVSADLTLIEDSADTNNKKKIQLGNIPIDGGSF